MFRKNLNKEQKRIANKIYSLMVPARTSMMVIELLPLPLPLPHNVDSWI